MLQLLKEVAFEVVADVMVVDASLVSISFVLDPQSYGNRRARTGIESLPLLFGQFPSGCLLVPAQIEYIHVRELISLGLARGTAARSF